MRCDTLTSLLTSISWCNRCERIYRSLSALYQHVRDSPRHYECPECDFDGTTWDNLLQHCRTEGCRRVCQGCDGGRGEHWSIPGYSIHVRVSNVCTDCERHFTSPSHLYQVSRLASFATLRNQGKLASALSSQTYLRMLHVSEPIQDLQWHGTYQIFSLRSFLTLPDHPS